MKFSISLFSIYVLLFIVVFSCSTEEVQDTTPPQSIIQTPEPEPESEDETQSESENQTTDPSEEYYSVNYEGNGTFTRYGAPYPPMESYGVELIEGEVNEEGEFLQGSTLKLVQQANPGWDFKKIYLSDTPTYILNRDEYLVETNVTDFSFETWENILNGEPFSIDQDLIIPINVGANEDFLFLPKEPYDSFPSKKYLLANIMVALGGRLAEKVFYKNKTKNDVWFEPIQDLDITTGASNDLKQANSIARTYVNLFGNVGIYDGQDTSTPFLGRELANGGSKLSEYSKEEIDKQIEQIVSFCYDKVEQMFEVNEDKLQHWSRELLKKKILDQSFFI